MENIELTFKDGVYDCDINITTQEWVDIIKDNKLTKSEYKNILLLFLEEPDHKSTCKELGEKYNINSQQINAMVMNFGKAIQKKINRYHIFKDNQEKYWPYTMIGRDKGSLFEYTVRPNLVEALNKCHFSWIPFYTEMAQKLLSYKDNRKSLLEIVYSLNKEWIKQLKNQDGSDFTDICPYTIMSLLNRSISFEKRVSIAEHFKEKMSIKASIPNDFDGLPVMDSRKICFFEEETAKEEIPILWNMFDAELKDNVDAFRQSFDNLQKFDGVKWNITMGMYWIQPYDYLSLDGNNRTYLTNRGINVFDGKGINSENYFTLLDNVKRNIDDKSLKVKDIPSLTYEAWFKTALKDKLTMGTKYWLLGYNFGSNSSQFERFIKENIWEGRISNNDKKQIELAKIISAGDIAALKTTYTAGKEHKTSILCISAIGIISEVLEKRTEGDDFFVVVKVQYQNIEDMQFSGGSYGSNRKTVNLTNNDDIINYINSKIDSKQIASSFPNPYLDEMIKLLRANHNLILTGAPGTGKTYLAKQIAFKMQYGTDNQDALTDDQKEEFSKQFVQFHPSYDYTDFVEGLRPVSDDNNSAIGFERKDGTFKAFCIKALQNYLDSHKTQDTLNKEISIKNKIDSFLSNAVEEQTQFKLKTGTLFNIIDSNDNYIYIKTSNEITKDIKLNMQALFDLLSTKDQLDFVADIRKNQKRKFNTQQDSYMFVLFNEIKQKKDELFNSKVNIVPKKDYVFVIDEINRGEISKIFGELFFSIDPGYRGDKGKVATQYQNLIINGEHFSNGFFVPENVYIIGTMNDIDRSVESMDFAMRRRFAWKEITAKKSQKMLDYEGAWKINQNDKSNKPDQKTIDEIKRRMDSLNEAIVNKDIGNLSKSYQIGASYFLKYALYADQIDNNPFESLWKYHLKGLLYEYLRGSENLDATLKKLKDAYDIIKTNNVHDDKMAADGGE